MLPLCPEASREPWLLTAALLRSIPAPVQSLDGDVLLSSEGGQAFRMSSLYLRHTSAVMASLFETQTEQLQQAAAAGVPLLVPLKDTAAPHIFLLLQVSCVLLCMRACLHACMRVCGARAWHTKFYCS